MGELTGGAVVMIRAVAFVSAIGGSQTPYERLEHVDHAGSYVNISVGIDSTGESHKS